MSNLLRTILEIHNRGGSAPDLFQTSGEPGAGGLQAVKDLTSSLQRLGQQGVEAYSELTHSSQNWSTAATRATSEVMVQIMRNIGLQQRDALESGKAQASKSLLTISALKELAPIKAAVNVAKALEDLGDFNFWGAAQHFASAAMWGTVGAAQVSAMVGGFGGGGHGYGSGIGAREGGGSYRGSNGSESSAGIPVSGLAAGAAGSAHPPSGNLTVAIMGDEHAGQWLADTLNTAVEQRGVQLTASRAMQSPYAQG